MAFGYIKLRETQQQSMKGAGLCRATCTSTSFGEKPTNKKIQEYIYSLECVTNSPDSGRKIKGNEGLHHLQ